MTGPSGRWRTIRRAGPWLPGPWTGSSSCGLSPQGGMSPRSRHTPVGSAHRHLVAAECRQPGEDVADVPAVALEHGHLVDGDGEELTQLPEADPVPVLSEGSSSP